MQTIVRKEFQTEIRSAAGLASATLFGLLTVVSIAYSAFGVSLSGTLVAGMMWVTFAFSAVIGTPRSFIAEEEAGTMNLLRLWADPFSIYWGKFLFAAIIALVQSLVFALLFLLFVSKTPQEPALLIVSVIFGTISLTSSSLLCGAIASAGGSRTTLAAALALPLMLPLMLLCVSSTRAALGDGIVDSGWRAALGLVGYAAISLGISPYLYAAIWKS